MPKTSIQIGCLDDGIRVNLFKTNVELRQAMSGGIESELALEYRLFKS